MIAEDAKMKSNNFDNISLTAYRIICILKFLYKNSASDADINSHLEKIIPDGRKLSQDTIGIYINTLKAIGCNISRPKKSNEFKYELLNHPFKPNLKQEEINALFNVRKFLSSLDDWRLIIETEKLVDKIINSLDVHKQEEFSFLHKKLFRGYSLKDKYNLVESIEEFCNQKKYITFLYESANSNKQYVSIIAKKLAFENDALYLWGFDILKNDIKYYRVDRIQELTSTNMPISNYNYCFTEVIYELKGFSSEMFVPTIDDEILKENKKIKLIKSNVYNKFKFFQDALSYGCECKIIEPLEFKSEHIQRLKRVLSCYIL